MMTAGRAKVCLIMVWRAREKRPARRRREGRFLEEEEVAASASACFWQPMLATYIIHDRYMDGWMERRAYLSGVQADPARGHGRGTCVAGSNVGGAQGAALPGAAARSVAGVAIVQLVSRGVEQREGFGHAGQPVVWVRGREESG